MRLSKRKALEICIELWSWLGSTGSAYKEEWPGWKINGGKYPEMKLYCSLCEYDSYRHYHNKTYKSGCYYCPLKKELNYCGRNSLFYKWNIFSGDKSIHARQIRDLAIKALNELK